MNVSFILAIYCFKERFQANRMKVLWPLLTIFIIGSAWGLSDPKLILPGQINLSTGYSVLYVASAFILLSATLGAVFVSFDGISRDRISGVLEIKLSQPMPRRSMAFAIIFGHWATIAIPTILLSLFAVIIVGERMDNYPELSELILYIFATSLVLLWYTLIQLVASSWANDMGSSLALGLGSWMLFTLLWLLLTSVVAGLAGISVNGSDETEWRLLQSQMDLVSPNGLYHLLLEIYLPNHQKNISDAAVLLASLLWTVLPIWIFVKRVKKLEP